MPDTEAVFDLAERIRAIQRRQSQLRPRVVAPNQGPAQPTNPRRTAGRGLSTPPVYAATLDDNLRRYLLGVPR
jgi:hypothetical protein